MSPVGNGPEAMIHQIVANGVIAGSVYLLVAVGFGLIYSTARFFHFAHAAVVTAGAYTTYAFTVVLGVPVLVAALIAVPICAALGCLIEIAVYRPLRHRRASSLVSLLASLGTYVVLQNTISLVFGDETRTLPTAAVSEGLHVLGARITWIQIVTIAAGVGLTIALTVLMTRTRMGLALRAVGNDRHLAAICGVDSDYLVMAAVAIGSAMAAVAGILMALDVAMTPVMGMRPLMMGIVAVILGGTRRASTIALSALAIAVAQQFGAWRLGAQWQDAIAFAFLLGFLLLRPKGFLGRVNRRPAE